MEQWIKKIQAFVKTNLKMTWLAKDVLSNKKCLVTKMFLKLSLETYKYESLCKLKSLEIEDAIVTDKKLLYIEN